MKPNRPPIAGLRREELLQEREHVAELYLDVGLEEPLSDLSGMESFSVPSVPLW